MIKKPNSIVSFIFSFISTSVVLDYLLWPKTIKANETIEQGIQIKLIAGIVFLAFSFYFRNRAILKEPLNRWTRVSGILNSVVIAVYVLSILFFIYIELTKK